MSSRTRLSFDVELDPSGKTITIQIADPSGLQADNLALATWGSSEILANILHQLPQPDFTGTGPTTPDTTWPVLELGAGTGLVGLSAAVIWQTSVCLTDLEPLVSNLEANIALNKDLLGTTGGGTGVCAGILDWAHPLQPIIPGTFASNTARVILAADTVYSEEHPGLLTNAISARLEVSEKARFIMCYPLRIGYLDHIRDLWERLEGAGLECTQEGREKLGEGWDEDVEYEWCTWGWKAEVLRERTGGRG